MKEHAYVTTNFTGRKFMCMSLEETHGNIEEWASGFSIGNIYYECRLDSDGDNLAYNDDGIAILMDDNKNTIYADINQFAEVEGMHKMLNNMWIALN